MENNSEDTMNIQRITDYTPWYNWVVEWNERASPGKQYTEADIDNQWRLVEEEFKELIEAYDNKDSTAFYKELSDLFVVSSFYEHVTNPRVNVTTVFADRVEMLLADIEQSVWSISSSLFDNVMILMNSVNVNSLSRAMFATLKSNDTKFFRQEYSDMEIAWALKAHGDRYDGIHVKRTIDGLATLRDENNKILKPSTYKPYTEFLRWIYV